MTAVPPYLEELFDVRGKRVVVTGGARGIGLAIATGFVEAGADVIVSSRVAEDSAAAAAQLSGIGSCRGVRADLSTVAGCRGLAAEVAALTDRVDVLINNAGSQYEAPLHEFSEQGWDDVLDVNTKAPFFVVQAFLPLLRAAAARRGPARVISVGSINGLHASSKDTFAYSAAKAALHHLSSHLAKRLAPDITVNALALGMFESGMRRDGVPQQREPGALGAVPLGRYLGPTDLAGTTLYLASAAGAYVTGAVLPVDGGTATTL